ncbi:hypothetical protein NVV90_13815 [Arthrobacter sp. CJ23]|nr:hypothetical protein NVV90_13815 [Arthrobacter sp. CJ23]
MAPWLHLPWSLAAVLVCSLLAAALVLGIRVLTQGKSAVREATARWRPRPSWRLTVPAYLLGAAVVVVQLALAFGHPANISQTFDNVFHLNSVRYILDTGNASSLTMSAMTSGDNPPYFYPAAWHDLAALLVTVTGAPLVLAVNMLNIAVAALIWPLGCMLLTRVFAGAQPLAVAAAGVLSAFFSGFPLLLLDFGVLYPNFLAISLLPAALGAMAWLFRRAEEYEVHVTSRFLIPCLMLPGLALAHPNGLMSLLAVTIPLVLQSYLVRYWPSKNLFRRRGWIVASLGLLLALATVAVLWKVIRPPEDAAFWPPIQSPARAALQILSNSAMGKPLALTVSVLMLIGLAVSMRRLSRTWLIGGFVIVAFLFMVVSAAPFSRLRSLLTGVWYNDSYRIAALLPLVAVPFAAVGFAALMALLKRRFPAALTHSSWRKLVRGSLLALLGIAGVAGLIPPVTGAVASARANYDENAASPLLSTDEHRLISQLDAVVPADAVIAVNPWTGGALAYALAQRETTAKHILTATTGNENLLNQHLRDAPGYPDVCAAASAENVRFVLDFGDKEVHGNRHSFPGLENLAASPSFRLVLQEGQARLYELTACPAG